MSKERHPALVDAMLDPSYWADAQPLPTVDRPPQLDLILDAASITHNVRQLGSTTRITMEPIEVGTPLADIELPSPGLLRLVVDSSRFQPNPGNVLGHVGRWLAARSNSADEFETHIRHMNDRPVYAFSDVFTRWDEAVESGHQHVGRSLRYGRPSAVVLGAIAYKSGLQAFRHQDLNTARVMSNQLVVGRAYQAANGDLTKITRADVLVTRTK